MYSESHSCCSSYLKRADIRTRHDIVLVRRGVGDQVGRADLTLGTKLVEEVRHIHAKVYILVHVILDASERLPPTVEIERVGLVDILLGEVAEVKIESEFANGVARVEFDEDLRHLRHRHAADVHAVSHAVGECGMEHLQTAAILGQSYVLATRGDNFISMRRIQSLKCIANDYPACAALTSTH